MHVCQVIHLWLITSLRIMPILNTIYIYKKNLLLYCLSVSCCLRKPTPAYIIRCWPQSGRPTAGVHFGELSHFLIAFGLLRALLRPISGCFISVLLPVLESARV